MICSYLLRTKENKDSAVNLSLWREVSRSDLRDTGKQFARTSRSKKRSLNVEARGHHQENRSIRCCTELRHSQEMAAESPSTWTRRLRAMAIAVELSLKVLLR